MHKKYAKALFDLLLKADKDKQDKVIKNFVELLKAKGKVKLLPKVLFELGKLYEKHEESMPHIYYTKDSDLKAAKEKLAVLELSNTPVKEVKDQQLIGGFKIKSKNFVFDASYKKFLLDLYDKLRSV